MWSLIGGPNVVDAELCIRFDFFAWDTRTGTGSLVVAWYREVAQD